MRSLHIKGYQIYFDTKFQIVNKTIVKIKVFFTFDKFLEKNMETNNEHFQESKTEIKPKKSKTGLIILLVILGFILIGAGGYFFLDYKHRMAKIENENELSQERLDAIKGIFSVAEYDNIPENYREHIYNFLEYNNYLDGTYFLTKIADRAKSVYAFGDFTDDDNDEDDLAVLFENNDYTSSMLVIFNHKGEGLYIKNFENELPTINAFKVGAKIYENEAKLTPATCGGLMIKTDYRKEALVYNKKTKKFNSHYQYTDDEIKSMNEPEEYYDEGYEEENTEEAPEASIINSINQDSN